MQDSEEHSPLEQSPRSYAHDNGYITDDSQAVAEDVDQEGESDRALPLHGMRYALIAGTITGVLCFLLQTAITFLNTPVFQKFAGEGQNSTYATAQALALPLCIDFLLNLVLCFLVGFLVGRVVVQRRLGFIAGALAGGILYLGGFLANYIPGYPGQQATNVAANAGQIVGGLLFSLVLLLIGCAIGGLMGLWGATTSTRSHPYYAH